MKRLAIPVNWPEQPLLAYQVKHDEVVKKLGTPQAHNDDPLQVPGPTDYWAFEFDCGLQVMLSFGLGLGRDWLYVDANSFEIDHALFHLDFPWPLHGRMDQIPPGESMPPVTVLNLECSTYPQIIGT